VTNPLPSTIHASTSRLLALVGVVALLGAACATTSGVASPSASTTTLMWGWERHFAVDWTVDDERAGGLRLRGYLHNHHGEFALSVRLLAQALDESGAVVAQRLDWVPGGVPAFSRVYFEMPRLPSAASYRVSVWEYTWLQSDGDRT
jgi:hypothetical protein